MKKRFKKVVIWETTGEDVNSLLFFSGLAFGFFLMYILYIDINESPTLNKIVFSIIYLVLGFGMLLLKYFLEHEKVVYWEEIKKERND